MLSQRESDLIAVGRITMIVGLIYHHLFKIPGSPFYPRDSFPFEGAQWPDAVNAFFHWATMAAVPALGLISGYLFFRSIGSGYAGLLVKRFRSTLVPMVLWCSVWLGFAFALTLISRHKGGFGWADYGFDDFSLMTLLNGIFGITRTPFAFQFWFVHDLVLTMLLSPVIGWLIRAAGGTALILLGILWFLELIPFPFFSGNVLFFFTIGAYLALHPRYSLEGLAAVAQRQVVIVGCLLTALILLRMFSGYFGVGGTYLRSEQALMAIRIAGVLFFLGIIYRAAADRSRITGLVALSQYSFFIFAFHFPTIEIVKSVARQIPLHSSTLGLFVGWLAVPLVTLLVCLLAARALKALNADLYGLMNGGRERAGRWRLVVAPRSSNPVLPVS